MPARYHHAMPQVGAWILFGRWNMEGDRVAVLPKNPSWKADLSLHLRAYEAFVSHVQILGQRLLRDRGSFGNTGPCQRYPRSSVPMTSGSLSLRNVESVSSTTTSSVEASTDASAITKLVRSIASKTQPVSASSCTPITANSSSRVSLGVKTRFPDSR